MIAMSKVHVLVFIHHNSPETHTVMYGVIEKLSDSSFHLIYSLTNSNLATKNASRAGSNYTKLYQLQLH